MSAYQEVHIKNATADVITKGALAYAYKVQGDQVTIEGRHFTITPVGSLGGDFDRISNIGPHVITKDQIKANTQGEQEEKIAKIVCGRLVQAGTIVTAEEYLTNNQFIVKTDAIHGKLEAKRANQTIDAYVDENGILKTDLNGFKGDSCLNTLEGIKSLLGKISTLKSDRKTVPKRVMRQVIN